MNLDKFFNAKSIAIIGVSVNPNKVGHVIFRNFVDTKFKGNIFPVNPNLKELLNCKCYPSVLKIKQKVELAIIAIPAEIILKTIEQCGKKGIKNLVIITSGFEEIGNYELVKKVEKLLDKYKIKVIGPNCLGVYNAYNKLDTLFLPQSRLQRPGKGGISFVCQSGAAGSALLDLAAKEHYGFAKFASYGNAINVDETDIIEYLGDDPQTKVICLYVEGVKSGRKFIDVCKQVSKKKPIIAIKGGVSEAGSKATLSHTGSLAGSAQIYEGAFKQANIIQAHSLREMFDFARILEQTIKPKGRRVQVITNGGGYGILCTDAIEHNGLVMAEMDDKVRDKLKKKFPPIVTIANPMDLVGDADTNRYKVAIDATLNDKNVDIILLVLLFQTPLITTDIVDVVSGFNDLKKKPIITVSTGGEFTKLLQNTLEKNGISTFKFPSEAVMAVKALCDYHLKE